MPEMKIIKKKKFTSLARKLTTTKRDESLGNISASISPPISSTLEATADLAKIKQKQIDGIYSKRRLTTRRIVSKETATLDNQFIRSRVEESSHSGSGSRQAYPSSISGAGIVVANEKRGIKVPLNPLKPISKLPVSVQ